MPFRPFKKMTFRQKARAARKRSASAHGATARSGKRRVRPIIKRRKLSKKSVAKRKEAAITKVVAKVLGKQREKRAIKARTPYSNVSGYSALKGNCNTSYAIGHIETDNRQNDNWRLMCVDYGQQGEYSGQRTDNILREGSAVRITAVKDAGRVELFWPSLESTWTTGQADNASAAKQWVDHFQVLLRFKAQKHGILFAQNNASGNIYRRIVYGLIMTTNKPDMSVVTAATSNTATGDELYSGENYSSAMRRPLHEEKDDATNSWEDIRSQFTVEVIKRKRHYRPKQSHMIQYPAYGPGGINSSDVEILTATFTTAIRLPECTSEFDYSFSKLYKGGLLTRYEDQSGASEVTAELSEKPLILCHMLRSGGNLSGDTVGIGVTQCYGSRSVYWSDL